MGEKIDDLLAPVEGGDNVFAGLLGNEQASEETPAEEVSEDATDDTAAESDSNETEEGTETQEGEESEKFPGLKKRLERLVEQRNEEREARLAIEERLEHLKTTQAALVENYNRFDNPEAQFRDDVRLVDAIEKLQNVPEVAKALEKIADYYKTGRVEGTMSNQDRPAEDPRVEKLLRQNVENQVKGTLERSNVRPEFHRAILNQVSALVDPGQDLTSTDVKEAIRHVIEENGWTQEMLVGGGKKAGRTAPPTGKAKSASKAPTTPKTAAPAAEAKETTDPEELKAQLRNKLIGLVS